MPPLTPKTTMIWGKPRPTMDMMVSRSSNPGKAIQPSIKRCTTRSTFPPRNPEMPPIRTATTRFRVDNPTGNTQRLLLEKTDEEISQPGTSLWRNFC